MTPASRTFAWLRQFAKLWGFALFCVLSSSVYVLNDVVDAESDRQHPDKRHRPIASGELDSNAVKRVEDHLIDCGPCRSRLAHLRNGHRLAQEMPRFTCAA